MFFFLASTTSKLDLTRANDNVVSNVIGKERWLIGNILNVIRILGTGVALIMITWMSISYFTADGRGVPWGLEKKADLKGRQLMNFVIGAFVFIGAGNIIYFITQLLMDIFSSI